MYYTVRGILQAKILEWVAFPFSRGSYQPRDWTQVSHTAGRFFYQLNNQGNPRTLEWVAIPFSWGCSQPRNWTGVSCTTDGFFTNWAIRKAQKWSCLDSQWLKYPGIFLGLYSSKLLWPQSFAGISLRTWLVLVLNYAFSELTCSLCSITSHYPLPQGFKGYSDNNHRVMELGIESYLKGHLAPTSYLWHGWQIMSQSHIPWKWFHASQGQLFISWKALLESSFFCGAQTCLTIVRFFFSASKQPWWMSYHMQWMRKCKSFKLTVSFLAFITFTGPVKWFRFQNLNPWPSLSLPNIFCQEASWTFEGKVNQMGVCFSSAKAKCLQRPAGLFLSVGCGRLPRLSRGVCLWWRHRRGLVEMATDAGEGSRTWEACWGDPSLTCKLRPLCLLTCTSSSVGSGLLWDSSPDRKQISSLWLGLVM